MAHVTARRAAALALALVLCAAPAPAQDERAPVLERRVKAALLYRFLNYVEWPAAAFAGPHDPVVIAIAGADALAAELADFVATRKVLNRTLAVRAVRGAEKAHEAQVLFVGAGAAAQLGALARSAQPSALVVAESADALQLGSVINFVIVDGQVRFEVSLDAARQRNLRLSSRLLSVAYHVHGATP
jgi:hypothetical protein